MVTRASCCFLQDLEWEKIILVMATTARTIQSGVSEVTSTAQGHLELYGLDDLTAHGFESSPSRDTAQSCHGTILVGLEL